MKKIIELTYINNKFEVVINRLEAAKERTFEDVTDSSAGRICRLIALNTPRIEVGSNYLSTWAYV